MKNAKKLAARLGACAGAALMAGPVAAAQIQVTVENLQGPGGFSLTPFYVAFHDGTFDAFSSGDAASPGVELLAELGDPSGLPPERLAVDPESTAQVITQPANGPPTIDPGESGTTTFALDPTGGEQRYMTFLSMIVPSNDQFIGNGNPLAFEIFDDAGAFNGPQTFDITALFAYDAGTEVNDALNGPAFVIGTDATMGTPENGVITQGLFPLDEFLGLQTPAGLITQSLDITNDLAGTSIARITVEAAPPAPVPLPAAAPYLLTALGSLALARRRLKAKVRGEGKVAAREGWKALFRRMGRGTGSVLLRALNAIAESDRRHREELRLRGVSDDFLKDVGLTRRQLETAYSRQAPLSLGRLQRATAMPSG